MANTTIPLELSAYAPTASGATLELQTTDTTVTDGSVLGKIEFKAPSEASGTDAILVGAAIEAVAEGTFAADNNATELVFKTGASEAAAQKMVLTSSGKLGLGITSPSTDLHISGANDDTNGQLKITGTSSGDAQIVFTTDSNGRGVYLDESDTNAFKIYGGAGKGSNEVIIDNSGNVMIGTTSNAWNVDGTYLAQSPFCYMQRTDGSAILFLHRRGTDGTHIQFWHSNQLDGYISGSSGVISLTGFQGSHSSSGDGISADTAIGTVVSTIDEEHSERHAKIKVSDSVGDKRVYGTIEKWNPKTTEDNGQTIEAYALVASTGVGSVRVTGACEGGDLLESNGDGTAKVQSDDIIRSKTIGKVTIGNSNTGVKLVSCVLYCG